MHSVKPSTFMSSRKAVSLSSVFLRLPRPMMPSYGALAKPDKVSLTMSATFTISPS